MDGESDKLVVSILAGLMELKCTLFAGAHHDFPIGMISGRTTVDEYG